MQRSKNVSNLGGAKKGSFVYFPLCLTSSHLCLTGTVTACLYADAFLDNFVTSSLALGTWERLQSLLRR